MPTKPARACRFSGCPYPAISRGRCQLHSPADEQQRHRYGSAIYNDKRWRGRWGLRQQVLTRQPLCVLCLEQQRTSLATVVDHIRPHRGDERLAFDIANLRSLCASCHSRITAGQVQDRR
jgi:5-methylcytosine-specific restriction protein A